MTTRTIALLGLNTLPRHTRNEAMRTCWSRGYARAMAAVPRSPRTNTVWDTMYLDGGKRTDADRVARLREAGVSTDDIARLAARIGLDSRLHQVCPLDSGYATGMDASRVGTITVDIDGALHRLSIDNRTTLLDALREHLGVISPKTGCDNGQCRSCTVLLDGRRIVTCLTFAVAHDGAQIVTAAGLTDDDTLHPVQQAFVDQECYQCGYCTPGQVCSAATVLDEFAAGQSSDLTSSRP